MYKVHQGGKGGIRRWSVTMVDCPKCGAKAGFTCDTRPGGVGVGAWSFHNERWLVAPVRNTWAIEQLRRMRDVKPKKETHLVRVHIEQPVAG
jgi:hypothetical protein